MSPTTVTLTAEDLSTYAYTCWCHSLPRVTMECAYAICKLSDSPTTTSHLSRTANGNTQTSQPRIAEDKWFGSHDSQPTCSKLRKSLLDVEYSQCGPATKRTEQNKKGTTNKLVRDVTPLINPLSFMVHNGLTG